MQIDGAIVREQGLVFSIIIVKASAMSDQFSAARTRESFQSISDFQGMPMILASQDARGRFTYQGRDDIVHFLAGIDSRRIPWKRYTVS